MTKYLEQLRLESDELYHSQSHKYVSKVYKNGKWHYVYPSNSTGKSYKKGNEVNNFNNYMNQQQNTMTDTHTADSHKGYNSTEDYFGKWLKKKFKNLNKVLSHIIKVR